MAQTASADSRWYQPKNSRIRHMPKTVKMLLTMVTNAEKRRLFFIRKVLQVFMIFSPLINFVFSNENGKELSFATQLLLFLRFLFRESALCRYKTNRQQPLGMLQIEHPRLLSASIIIKTHLLPFFWIMRAQSATFYLFRFAAEQVARCYHPKLLSMAFISSSDNST